MGYKRFKDPIYGYIEIDESLIRKIVDTAIFQRLRDIVQTSYAPLYSSAVHNRFVHSLGVYHLGRIAGKSFRRSLKKQKSNIFPSIQKCFRIFELACLLHDVGHAPFSHTGEIFYLDKGGRAQLHKTLIDLIGDFQLTKEIENYSYKAAPHEIMSVIISLRMFSGIIPDDMKSFFARCITGYKYVNEMTVMKSCMNCFIELLNSKIIDVDKMDYLLRDSYMIGFDTVSVDYIRLLDSICVVEDEQGFFRICYYKAAISVIENVVYAHDAERKWIQNHPIVLYDAYLIENIIGEIVHQILKNNQLSEDLLTEQGKKIADFGVIRLMGDSDIRYLMKNLPDCSYAGEYYERNIRKHPIWKTEAEFQAIFQGKEKELEVIENEFESLRTYLRSVGLPFVINKTALIACQGEVKQIRESEKSLCGIELAKNKATLEIRKKHLKWMEILEEFSLQEDIDFNFLIIYANQFNSGFRKQEFGDIEMIFPELKVPCKFSEVTNVLTSQKSKGEKFFFLYYARKYPGQNVRIAKLIKEMLQYANTIHVEKSTEERLI